MSRWSVFVILAMLFVPATVAGQRKPSTTMQTRSAEVYLNNANNTADTEKRNEELRKALGVLTDGARRDSDNPLVWMMMGQAYARMGDVAGADSAFDKAELLYPEYAEEIEPERLALWINAYNSGIAAIQEGDPLGAIEQFETADMIYRGRPDALVTLGSLYMQAGDLPKSEEAYAQAIEVARGPAAAAVPEAARAEWAEQEATAAVRLAELQSQLGRSDDAIATYRALVASQPENPQAVSGLAAELTRAGMNDEAASIYEGLMSRDDLSDVEWFNAGVGLYSAQNHSLAAKAFEKSLEVNPYARDAMYNLGQALYGMAADLERERSEAPEGEQAAFNEKIAPIYEQLAEVATKLREVDPSSRNPVMMLAQAQRSMAEMADEAAQTEWREKVLATLQIAEDMPFDVAPVETQFVPGGVTISGEVTNLSATPGQEIVLEFVVVGEGGAVVTTETVRVTAPEVDDRAAFEFDVATDDLVLGWRYTVGG